MPEISALQMVFSRVEPEYSPKKVSGFQTVYASPGLETDEITFIEARVSCYHPTSGNQPSRKQFFQLPSGRIVLTNTVTIESDPIITDKDRRSGAFIAHCLVLSASDFKLIFNNPFKIFDEFQFLTSPQEMIHLFLPQAEKAPLFKLDIDPHYEDSLDPVLWSQATRILFKIEHLRLTKDRLETMLLLGTQEQVEKVLRAFINIAPYDLRSLCSFTTNIDSCRIQSGNYWAAGATFMPDGRFEAVHLSNFRSFLPDQPAKSDNIYTRWLARVSKELPPKSYREVTSVQAIDSAFRTKTSIPQFVDIDSSSEVYQIYQQVVLDSIKKAISSSITVNLTQMATALLIENSNFNSLLTISSTGTIKDELLAILCRQIIINSGPEFLNFEKNDWNSISNFGEKVNDYLLVFWASGVQKNIRKAKSALEKLSIEDFQTAIQLINAPIEPVFFFSRYHLKSFLQVFGTISLNVSDDDFIKVVISIHDTKATAALQELAQRVNIMDNNHLTNLEDILGKEMDLAPNFARAMQARRKKLGRPAGIAGWFYKE